VYVDRGILTIEGKHEDTREEKDKNRRFVRVERALGTVRRSFRLPENCDATQISAKYDHGVLKVRDEEDAC
jgi:HSP20 family protein